jgi:hypothetical protein
MRQERVDAFLDDAAHRIEELVDRRSDGDDDRRLGRDFGRIGGEQQALARKRAVQKGLAATLDERQPAGAQRVENGAIEIMHVDAQSGLGERQHQRNADVPPTAHDREVGRLHARRRDRGRACTGKIHVSCSAAAFWTRQVYRWKPGARQCGAPQKMLGIFWGPRLAPTNKKNKRKTHVAGRGTQDCTRR